MLIVAAVVVAAVVGIAVSGRVVIGGVDVVREGVLRVFKSFDDQIKGLSF